MCIDDEALTTNFSCCLQQFLELLQKSENVIVLFISKLKSYKEIAKYEKATKSLFAWTRIS